MRTNKHFAIALISLIPLISFAFSLITPKISPTASHTITPSPRPSIIQGESALVTRVVDGDTIELSDGRRVRYIGVDTPESVAPNQPIECYGTNATEQNRQLVLDQHVTLVKDVSETDKYGRLLRYVYIGDTFVNDYLVRQGYANARTYPPDIRFQTQLKQAETEARTNNRGLWKSCVLGQTTQTQPSAQPDSTPSDSCTIKANINADGEKIYHLPTCQTYAKTKIDLDRGEHYFCTEQQALDAGWRKAGNCP